MLTEDQSLNFWHLDEITIHAVTTAASLTSTSLQQITWRGVRAEKMWTYPEPPPEPLPEPPPEPPPEPLPEVEAHVNAFLIPRIFPGMWVTCQDPQPNTSLCREAEMRGRHLKFL